VGAVVAAVAVLMAAGSVLRRVPDRRDFRLPAGGLLVLTAVQILLGGTIIWTQRQPLVASAHVVTGAILLGTSFVLTARAWRFAPPRHASTAPAHFSEPAGGKEVPA
jgi:heme A synthase